MTVKPIPDGYHSVTPYLAVTDAAHLIDFMKAAFGAEETFRMATPAGAVMHAELRIGDSMLMTGEPQEEGDRMPGMVHLYMEDVDAAYNRALAAGATSVRQPQDQFYGDRSAGVRDAFGNVWWLATHIEDVPPEEMERRAAAQMAGT